MTLYEYLQKRYLYEKNHILIQVITSFSGYYKIKCEEGENMPFEANKLTYSLQIMQKKHQNKNTNQL